MSDLIKLKATIHLFAGDNVRQTPFASGYRPLFLFSNAKTKISGRIDLIGGHSFEPGSSGAVTISFVSGIIDEIYFRVGEKFTFSEGQNELGSGEIIDIYF